MADIPRVPGEVETIQAASTELQRERDQMRDVLVGVQELLEKGRLSH